MNPSILLGSFIVFIICFTIHVIWWRYLRPRNDISALIVTFVFVPFVCFVVMFVSGTRLVDLFYITLLSLSLSGAYIMSYPAVQAKCPSLNIMLIVNDAMPGGIKREEIRKQLGGDKLLEGNVDKMIEEGLAKIENNNIIPTKTGNLIAWFFIKYRDLLGVKQGKG